MTRAEVYRRLGDEQRAGARLRAAAAKALRAEGSYLVLPELLLVAADLVSARAPMAAAQLLATARHVRRVTGFTVWPFLDLDRIAAGVGATDTNELAVDDALRLVLDCLDSPGDPVGPA